MNRIIGDVYLYLRIKKDYWHTLEVFQMHSNYVIIMIRKKIFKSHTFSIMILYLILIYFSIIEPINKNKHLNNLPVYSACEDRL